MEMSLHFHKSQCHYYFNVLVPGQLGTGSSRNEKSQKRSAQILGMDRPLNNDRCPKAGSRVFNFSFGELIKATKNRDLQSSGEVKTNLCTIMLLEFVTLA